MTTEQLGEWLQEHNECKATFKADPTHYNAVQVTVTDAEGKTLGESRDWSIEAACEGLTVPA